MAVTNLAELYNRLSDPSFPAVDLINFRSSLSQGFKKSNDVESMVKITALLYKDTRFSKDPAEKTGFFLYNLIDSSSEEEVQAQAETLKTYFTQLKTQNICITASIYKGIRNLLESYHVPELIKYVMAIVDPKQDKAQDLNGLMTSAHATGTEVKVLELEKKMEELIAEDKPISVVLKQLIQALCAEENLQQALQLKEKHEEEMTVGGYATLINLCCRHDNVDEALNLKREISRKDSSTVLDPSKYIALVRALSKNGRIEEAVDILKEMKEKEVVMDGSHVTMLFHLLNMLAAKGASEDIKKLQDTVFTLGLTKPSANMCSPLVTSYLESKNLSGALEAAMECQNRYNQLPRIHDIIIGLVEKGDTELLQKAMDFVSQKRGEMTMLYDLFFAFLQTGRYREARKIIETPGLRARPGRLQWYAERCISANQMEPLEQMVDITAKLFECDRDEMYSYIIRLCKETNDSRKAEAVWTKMQEENVIPRERTLRMVADILRNNGEEVPFEVPETWYTQTNTKKEAQTNETTRSNVSDYQVRIMSLCKKSKVQEAYRLLKDAIEKGVDVGPTAYDHVIRSLLSEGSMDDAMAVRKLAESHMPGFSLSDIASSLLIITQSKRGQCHEALENFKAMLSGDRVPSQLAITRLIQALGKSGDVEGIQSVESLMKNLGTTLNLSSMVFVNNTALAHIKNGDVGSAVELLEEVYTRPQSSSPSMSFVFRKVLEEGNDEALDKLSAMAERLANHFACYRPASDLFLQLLDTDKIEDAKFLLARCNAVAEQRDVLVSYMAGKSSDSWSGTLPNRLTVGRIKSLMSLIPDFAEKYLQYSYLMKCHFMDKDLSSAKALYEQMQKEGVPADELSLKRLAVLYRNQGETAPFPEPPESFKFYADKLRDRVNRGQERTD
ncbi:hypothetical protein fugu_012563 [Takifugu bimaculatus]|uniref:Pentacotripeptide-repeat region of PRORP domain-containing protein n=1 Tax=Takifugu bimaculatus TaxID=433685 RepID=A0A4Z2C5S9_9TELE|nr:hypothetical protein fugu_012563 [Takifugu bimaculatus]